MSFSDLYQEIILDHYKRPRNRRPLPEVSDDNLHENPTCGDSLKLALDIDGEGIIRSAAFDGRGCALSMASASMMSELLSGKRVEDAQEIIRSFIRMMQGAEPPERLEEWGDLAAFGSVVSFPVRVKCVTLAWHAAEATLDRGRDRGSREGAQGSSSGTTEG